MSFWGLYLCVYTQNTRTSQGKIFRHSIPNHDGSKPVMMMKNEGLCFCTLKRFDGIFLRIFFKIVSAAWTVKLVFKGLIRVVSDTPTPAPFYGTKGSFFAFGPPKEKKITKCNRNLTVQVVCTGYILQDWGIIFFHYTKMRCLMVRNLHNLCKSRKN